jgi:CheY-like chemotaxis protein
MATNHADPDPIVATAAQRILIVDDSELTTRLLQAELSGCGLEVLVATTIEQATRLVTRPASRPDLILLDVNMPGVDGCQFCRFLKSNEMFDGIKVIFCSSMPPEELRLLAAECQADGFVHKDDYLGRWVTEQCR